MADDFKYDVFLSHSSKDKAVVLAAAVWSVAWSADGHRAFSGDRSGGIRVWDLSEFVTEARASEISTPALPPAPDQVQYTNAKVLLVGESGAGKTGLSKVLAGEKWQPSDSTVGAWATQWKLPVSAADGVEREIWLWDFGGQADQRLIHQLYMDETALAVLVFDGQKDDLFETLGQWVATSRAPRATHFQSCWSPGEWMRGACASAGVKSKPSRRNAATRNFWKPAPKPISVARN